MKAVLVAFNQEKALVEAFSVITNLRMELFEALLSSHSFYREKEINKTLGIYNRNVSANILYYL